MKTCTKCKAEKSLMEFPKRKALKDGRGSWCKACVKANAKKNKEKIQKYHQKYYKDNKEVCNERSRLWGLNNKRKPRTEEVRKAYNKAVRLKRKERTATDSIFKLKRNISHRNRQAFKRKSWRKEGSQKLLGCTWEVAHKHLERQFVKGMSWENHGEWHIDHIIPLASATTKEELERLCHYTNLQPLWAYDNIIKGSKIVEHQIKLRI